MNSKSSSPPLPANERKPHQTTPPLFNEVCPKWRSDSDTHCVMRNIVVDIGNTRIKLGHFSPNGDLVAHLVITSESNFDLLSTWIDSVLSCHDDNLRAECNSSREIKWKIARTSPRSHWNTIESELKQRRSCDSFYHVTYKDIPISICVDHPEKVGIDRLVAATAAANLMKTLPIVSTKKTSAFIVDAGSAVTVDLISPDRAFLGGAILPGFSMLSKTFHQISTNLPEITGNELLPFSYPGKNTESAMTAGIWGAILGAIRSYHELIDSSSPIFLTGGDAEAIYSELTRWFKQEQLLFVPHLVLNGIALL
ncbi:MAG: type III pantothenate kinase [Thermoguttaceae bacterium]